ncbi:hypothetical protein GF336_03250 [Candidatus Woesearchaeota archaeon]|nr:hypothetical protein [Candidatus Woesearchaeota archaeon]
MKMTIVGSMVFLDKYEEAKIKLEEIGHSVILPEKDPMPEPIPKKRKLESMNDFNKNLLESDSIIVMNYTKDEKKNHIGANTLMEIGMAFNREKKIFILNPIPDFCRHELEAIGCVVLNGDLEKVR